MTNTNMVVLKKGASIKRVDLDKQFSWSLLFVPALGSFIKGLPKQGLLHLLLVFLMVIPGFIYGWYLAIKGNHLTTKKLIKSGYEANSKEDEAILKRFAFI